MPSNWLYIDTNFPAFTGEESTEKKVSTIQNYLYMLVEQLRWSLRNLDTSNMNQSALDRYENGLTDPIYRRLTDDEGNITQLQVDAKGLQSTVKDQEDNISQIRQTAESIQTTVKGQGDSISHLEQRADSIATTVSNQGKSISHLEQRADSIATTVSNQGKSISQIKQTAESITLGVSNGDTSSTIRLYRDGLEVASKNITFTGMVTFQGLSSGTTTINGACIKTGTIDAARLNLTGAITFSDLNYNTQQTITEASSSASSALSAASSAETIAKQIANGTYSGGTFINGKILYSPTVYSNSFQINAQADSGSLTLVSSYGECFKIRYQDIGIGPQVYIESRNGASLDFSGWGSINGLPSSTAVFA